MAVFYHYSRE